MADPIDPAIQQAFRDFARQLDRFGSGLGGAGSTATSTLTNFGSSLRTVGQGMARLRTDMDSGRRTFAESVQVYRQLRDDFENLGEATRSTAAGQRIREAQNVMANQLIRQNLGELAGEITKIGLVGALNYYKNQMITAVTSLQENVGGMQMAFDLQKQAITDTYSTINNFGQAITASGMGLAVFNPAVGAAVTGLGLITGQIANIMKGIDETSLQLLQREFKKTNDSFKMITSAGALFSLGMTEMRQEARRAQLDLLDYSKVIATNGENLAKLGGTVTEGAKRFSAVNAELIQYRRQLLNLGITEQDQAQATIDYMVILQDIGKLQNKSATQLAAETNDYLRNLKAISSITGEDVKKAQARARDASTQAAVNNKLSQAGEGTALKFRALIAQFPGLEKSIQQLYTIGSVVDPIQATFLAGQPALMAALKYNVQQLEKPGDTLDQYNINLQESLRQQGTSIRDQTRAVQGTFGMINVASGNLAELSTLTTQYSIFGEKLITKADYFGESRVMSLSDTADGLTGAVSQSQVLFNQFNSVVSQIIEGPLRDFAVKTPEMISLGAKKIIDSLSGYLKVNKIILTFDRNIDKVITDAVGAALRAAGARFEVQPMARGGVINRPTRVLAGEAGPEAFVPLSGGRSIPVNINIGENLVSKQFNNIFSQLETKFSENLVARQFNNVFATAMTQLRDLNQNNQDNLVKSIQDIQVRPTQVEINLDENLVARQFNNVFATAMTQLRDLDRIKQDNLVKSTQVRPAQNAQTNTEFQDSLALTLSRVMLDLKTQISGDNDKQLGAMQMQIDKLDSLIGYMRDNVAASENIANVLG